MAYVAPTWRNGGPPALDAAALQAISDAIVEGETKNASQDALIAALQTSVGGKGQIATGSYVGTGTFGENSPTKIIAGFNILICYVFAKNTVNNSRDFRFFYKNSPAFISGSATGVSGIKTLSTTLYDNFSIQNNQLSFYGENAVQQANTAGTTYFWTVLG